MDMRKSLNKIKIFFVKHHLFCLGGIGFVLVFTLIYRVPAVRQTPLCGVLHFAKIMIFAEKGARVPPFWHGMPRIVAVAACVAARALVVAAGGC